MQKKSCRYLLSYSPGSSMHCKVGPAWCIWTPILGEGEVVGGERWYHSKEWWWFSIGCPLWPVCYLWQFDCSLPLNWILSNTQINRGWVTLGQNLVGSGWLMLAKFSHDLWETWGYHVQKNLSRCLLPFEHNARTWQVDKLTVEW